MNTYETISTLVVLFDVIKKQFLEIEHKRTNLIIKSQEDFDELAKIETAYANKGFELQEVKDKLRRLMPLNKSVLVDNASYTYLIRREWLAKDSLYIQKFTNNKEHDVETILKE